MQDYKTTTDHQEIQDWANRHNAMPALIVAENPDDQALRFDFPGSEDERELTEARPSQRASWEEFFSIFDKNDLALVLYKNPQSDPTLSYRFIKAGEASQINKPVTDENW